MNKYISAMIAGLIGTVVLSILMIIKAKMGVAPRFDAIGDLSHFSGTNSMAVGWIGHFVIGIVVWGILFAIIEGFLPGKYWLRGFIYGIILWLIMMIIYMPVMGWGFFAAKLGVQVVIMTLVLHIIFGWVIGIVYGALTKKKAKG
ncbi:MAG: hypothetical protein EP298_03845 [Gammaproteobacteria bacterium]|nr:MAG: hypothetical protein EP298_03845 [Gammaproteobacteria bacterium]UTW43763.1 hypothetical protein KFE69_06650 [bacterium SCSIO 12844]